MVSRALANIINRGARITQFNEQSVTYGQVMSVQHAIAVFDTDGFWRNVYVGRLDIPRDVARVRLTASLLFTGATGAGNRWQDICDQSGRQWGCQRMNPSSYSEMVISTPVIDVTEGMWFEHRCYQDGGNIPNLPIIPYQPATVWFHIEVID